MSVPAGWEGILDAGETILWQGRPDTGFHFEPRNIGTALFGLLFAGFAVFWMVMASNAPGPFWMFGLIHFAVGVGLAANAIFGSTYRRRHTYYTLTQRRAFIATDMPFRGRTLKSHPITADTVMEYLPGKGLETILFGSESRRGSKGRRYTVKIGFERVPDGEEAYRIMREMQEGKYR